MVESRIVPSFRWNRSPRFSTGPYHLLQLLDILSISWSSESDAHDSDRHTRVCVQDAHITLLIIVFRIFVGHFDFELQISTTIYLVSGYERRGCLALSLLTLHIPVWDYWLNLPSALSYDSWFCNTTSREGKGCLSWSYLVAGCNPRRQIKLQIPCLFLKRNFCHKKLLSNESPRLFSVPQLQRYYAIIHEAPK